MPAPALEAIRDRVYCSAMNEPKPFSEVLCIGGTDPTGAAGLLLDQATLAVFGVHGSGAVTAVTVQNAEGISEVTLMPASTVGAQIDAVISTGAPACIKTGMLVGEDTVLALKHRVDRLGSSTKLIVDPVLSASSGRRLLDAEGQRALVRELFPRAALVTPNVPEAEVLTGRTINCADDMSIAADYCLALGASAVLIKGGHLPLAEGALVEPEEQELVVDLLRTLDGDELRLARPRLSGPGFRGTGCALATAIAALLAEGNTLAAAVTQAGDWLHHVMRCAPPPDVRAANLPRTLLLTPLARPETASPPSV